CWARGHGVLRHRSHSEGDAKLLHEMRWTAQKVAQRIELIEPLVYRRRSPLPPFRFLQLESPLVEPPVGIEVDDSGWAVVEPKTHWAGLFTNFVLRSEFQVPTDWPSGAEVALFLPLGDLGGFSHPEALAYIDGEAYATCDRHHQEFRLADRWRDGKPHLLALHGWTGLGRDDKKLFMRPCEVVQIHQPTRDFVTTARVALGVANMLDANNPAKDRLLNALDAAFRVLDVREPFGDGFYDSVGAAHQTLKDGIAKAGPPLDVYISASGHAHIDVAWLWTLGQTRRKAGRTFYTVM